VSRKKNESFEIIRRKNIVGFLSASYTKQKKKERKYSFDHIVNIKPRQMRKIK